MSLGLPGHLAPRVVRTGITRACHAVAMVCLAAGIAITAFQQAADPGSPIWPALLATLPIVALLVFVHLRPSRLSVAAYLLLGAAFMYLFSAVVLVQVPQLTTSNAWALTVFKIALLMVGPVGSRLPGGLIPPVAGYLLGELSIGLAVVATGKPLVFDIGAASALAIVVVIVVMTTLSAPKAREVQPAIHRAAGEERVAVIRASVEARAAALLHDTVLNDLAAISATPPGPLGSALRDRLRRDLETIVGEDWTSVDDGEPVRHDGAWMASGLAAAVDGARELGLEVSVSGDPDAVRELASGVDDALGLAARQLLVNVHKHAGVDSAEVVVYAGGDSLSVMVIDAGRGFDEAAVERDRLGLRQSVRRRIDAVGGNVQVWSAPGRGTSVLIQVPLDERRGADVAARSGDSGRGGSAETSRVEG